VVALLEVGQEPLADLGRRHRPESRRGKPCQAAGGSGRERVH
jgi:hypothetical protein